MSVARAMSRPTGEVECRALQRHPRPRANKATELASASRSPLHDCGMNGSERVLMLPPTRHATTLAATNKCLAQISKTGAGVRATKGHQPEGDLGEAKNKHLSLTTAE